ncbi:WYL domain-containing protein [Pannonibacter sp. SL95]|uniref:WYL domain-containing protein n=1 Tax=Pannonibacter sp. SL95 TaxID=2995153 RepID=UPI0022734316|nr:WYL domain-containing protein [Pannonibacter sp. SL95]MCY1707306.1 WYL domain-containing protein [Pannonibacter sp. SL95]
MTGIRSAIDAIAFEIALMAAPPPPRAIRLPMADDDEDDDARADLGHAEGQSFAIDYVNAKGEASTRRITVWAIREGADGTPLLYARCHERKAMRSFRVDRIACCIDYDGEVHDDVATFLADNFGMTPQLVTFTRPAARQPGSRTRWQEALAHISPHAILLAAVGRGDRRFIQVEADEAALHCAEIAERASHAFDHDWMPRLSRYIARLRPPETAIAEAVEMLRNRSPQEITSALVACLAVMDADGKRHSAELALVNAIAEDLTGLPIA